MTGQALDPDLLRAIEVSDWDLRRLVGPAECVVVQRQLSTIAGRARRGEDVLAELVALLDRHPELLRYVWYVRRMAALALRLREEEERWPVQIQQVQQQQVQQQQQQYVQIPGTGRYEKARLINTLVVDAAADERVLSEGEWLRPGRHYEILVSVGHYVEGSLLAFKEADWPSEALPDTGLWLRAVLSLPGARDPIVEHLSFPPTAKVSSATAISGTNTPRVVAHGSGPDSRWQRPPRRPSSAPSSSCTTRSRPSMCKN